VVNVKKRTVLVVDDLCVNVLALTRILESEWLVKSATDGVSALKMARENPIPDIILLDVKMPGMDGYEVCRQLKMSEETRDVPVIFITASDCQNDEAYGLELGAVDYIVKPINATVVQARVRNHIALQQAQNDLAIKNKELEQIAVRDALTGLYNRRKLDEVFDEEVFRAERYHRALSVVMMDVDHFKRVNDTYGHSAGDDVLIAIARALQDSLRGSDAIGRWGGEEFLLISPETDLETTVGLADRLRRTCESIDFPTIGKITLSMGVATHHSGDGAKEILLRADSALYRAKHAGRNRVEREESDNGKR